MGPGPVPPGGRHAAADVLTPYVRSLIRHKARRLCPRPRFGPADREDVQQELTLALLRKAHLYDPSRGACIDTFADRVVTSAAGMIARHRKRLKRAAGLTAASLDGGTALVDGRPVPLIEALDGTADGRLARAATPPPSDIQAVAAAVAELPPFPAAVARRLHESSVLAIARDLGVSRRKVYDTIAVIRARFEAAGLGPD